MSDQIINKIITLMKEQSSSFNRLSSLCERLTVVMVRGELDQIEVLTRTGERELLMMRARLAQITLSLSEFAELRAANASQSSVTPEVRSEFEEASEALLMAATTFQHINRRTSLLSINGLAFASPCIEMYGMLPSTYNAPYVRARGGQTWG